MIFKKKSIGTRILNLIEADFYFFYFFVKGSLIAQNSEIGSVSGTGTLLFRTLNHRGYVFWTIALLLPVEDIAIKPWLQLRCDYDTTTTYRARLLPFDAIRCNQKMNMLFLSWSYVVVSQANRNCDIGYRCCLFAADPQAG